jgi:hypothetical protein
VYGDVKVRITIPLILNFGTRCQQIRKETPILLLLHRVDVFNVAEVSRTFYSLQEILQREVETRERTHTHTHTHKHTHAHHVSPLKPGQVTPVASSPPEMWRAACDYTAGPSVRDTAVCGTSVRDTAVCGTSVRDTAVCGTSDRGTAVCGTVSSLTHLRHAPASLRIRDPSGTDKYL